MKITKVLTILLILIACAAAVSAQVDPAPTISVTAIPGTTVTNSVTIRASARDTSTNAGLNKIELYLNNNLLTTKQCGYATSCILSQARLATQPKNETFYAIAYDRIQSTTSSNLTVTFLGPNTPPNMTLLPNSTSINEDSGYNNLTDLWNYTTDTWTAPQNLTYTITGQTNTSMANCFITNNRWFECNTTTQDAFGSSIVTIQASDGQLSKQKNMTVIVLPVNDAPVFNISMTIPAITFAEDTSYVFNVSDYFYDVDNNVSSFSFSPASIGNMTITYNYNATMNKIQATLTPAQDWNGAVTTNFTANDGANSSGPSNNVLITVTPVNDAPFFTGTPPVGAWKDVPFSYQFNASDIDTGDVLTFYDNTSLFAIDLNSGWVNFTANATGNHTILITVCDNSNAANNCTNQTWNFTVYQHPPIIFTISPLFPVTYSPNATQVFSVIPIIGVLSNSHPLSHNQSQTIHAVWLEFNGTNYTAALNTTSGKYYVNLTNLAAGNYTFRWHANNTLGLHYNTTWLNFTINRANPQLMLNIPGNWTYGTPANVSCTVNTTQVTPVLMRNGTIVSNPDTTLLGAGIYSYFCYVNQSQNYTAANATGNMTVNPVIVTVNLTMQTPITYGTPANVTCNASPSAVTPTLTRNGVPLGGLTDTSVLGAGNYTYVCYYNATQNYTGDNETQTLIVNPVQTVINLTLNGTNGNINVPVNSTIIINATSNVPGALLNWYFNSTLMGTIPPAWITVPLPPGAYNITATYGGSQNYTAGSTTHWIFVAAPNMKFGWNPATGSTINSSFTLSFSTNYNTTCRWSFTDQAYTNMTNTFTTTGQTTHATTITGMPGLGSNNVHVACISDTAINNTDLNYNVQNIIEQGSTLTNGAAANNSILYSTSVDNSTLQTVNSTGSTIRGSILTNCVVINSTVKNYQGSNCRIVNSYVDPPNPGSDLTGSTITGNSRIMISNVTYSTVHNSNITSSNVNGSTIQNSELSYVTMNNCNVTNSILYNLTCVNAVIANGVLTSGTIIYNGTNYTAPPNVIIANVTNLPPNAAFISPTSIRRGSNAAFNAASSSDPNTGDTLTYFWDFGDSSNGTGVTTTHAYSATGTYNITLTVTDNQGAQDTAVRPITVTAPTGGGGTTGGGGGGGGGGGSAYYSSTWKIDLDVRPMDIRTMGRTDTAIITAYNTTHTMRMKGIDRQQINFTINDVAYSVPNFAMEKVNLDTDEYSDMRITILNNYYTRAQIRFDKVKELIAQQTVPLITGNLANLGMEEEESIIEQQIEEEQETKEEAPVVEEKQEEEMQEKEPIDNRIIGLGITAGVVIAGLIIYFLFSLILL